MPGSPVFHGAMPPNSFQGAGGAGRVETSSLNAGGSTDMMFFVWVAIIGIVVPIALMGGLQFGKFQFVFRR